MTRSLCDSQDECTETQKEAVKYNEGPLLIIAGPGTGKTRVIIEKVAYLIKREKVDPESILVITFTEKAAEELKNRLTKCVGLDVEKMQVSTIHSFCSKILHEYREYHDLGADFEILNEETQFIFIRAHFTELKLNMICTALGYFVAPYDILPEEIYRPQGYIDDIYLSSLILGKIAEKNGYELLEEYWRGEEDLKSVIRECQKRSKKILGKDTEKILSYVGLGKTLN
ncbi:MAG: UvrD-helicase domain-containing protein [Methanothermobacter sp.]|nr:UvrD-helicase domain-containing protein [Methanothermobacter sp.]